MGVSRLSTFFAQLDACDEPRGRGVGVASVRAARSRGTATRRSALGCAPRLGSRCVRRAPAGRVPGHIRADCCATSARLVAHGVSDCSPVAITVVKAHPPGQPANRPPTPDVTGPLAVTDGHATRRRLGRTAARQRGAVKEDRRWRTRFRPVHRRSRPARCWRRSVRRARKPPRCGPAARRRPRSRWDRSASGRSRACSGLAPSSHRPDPPIGTVCARIGAVAEERDRSTGRGQRHQREDTRWRGVVAAAPLQQWANALTPHLGRRGGQGAHPCIGPNSGDGQFATVLSAVGTLTMIHWATLGSLATRRWRMSASQPVRAGEPTGGRAEGRDLFGSAGHRPSPGCGGMVHRQYGLATCDSRRPHRTPPWLPRLTSRPSCTGPPRRRLTCPLETDI